jgi:hypothetical protein
MSTAAPAGAGLPQAAVEVLASIAEHRVLSTPQLRAINLPQSGLRWAQRILARLERAGLVAHVDAPAGPRRLWYVTERGARLALESGTLDAPPRLLAPGDVAGQLRAHTLAVNDAAICFLEAARQRGDEFGPLSWRHEVAHPLTRGRGRRRRQLVADAVFTYLLLEEGEVAVEQRFLELDRATLPVDRLAAGLARYARLYRAPGEAGGPAWRAWYPAFPPVICVLAGGPRAVLERRRDTAIALLRSDPELERTPEVAISLCPLEDLQSEGPFAPIFLDVQRPQAAVDWTGQEPAATSGHDRRGR